MPNDKTAARASDSTGTAPFLSPADIDRLIERHFPEIHFGGKTIFIDAVTAKGAALHMKNHPRHLRPGGTVSGPAMFALADLAVYAAILGRIGEQGLQAVTTNMALNFLRRPEPGDILADVELLAFGKRLIVAEVRLIAATTGTLVAIATATYAMPSAGKI